MGVWRGPPGPCATRIIRPAGGDRRRALRRRHRRHRLRAKRGRRSTGGLRWAGCGHAGRSRLGWQWPWRSVGPWLAHRPQWESGGQPGHLGGLAGARSTARARSDEQGGAAGRTQGGARCVPRATDRTDDGVDHGPRACDDRRRTRQAGAWIPGDRVRVSPSLAVRLTLPMARQGRSTPGPSGRVPVKGGTVGCGALRTLPWRVGASAAPRGVPACASDPCPAACWRSSWS